MSEENGFVLNKAWTYLLANQVFIYDESNNIHANCCSPKMRKICHNDEICVNYFCDFGRKKPSEEYVTKSLVELEKITLSELKKMKGGDRRLLIKKHQKKAYKSCRKINIDTFDAPTTSSKIIEEKSIKEQLLSLDFLNSKKE